MWSGSCSDPSYVPIAFEKSLARLQTGYIDLYYQHRVDTKVPIEVVVESFRSFFESGKLKYLGLSECSIDTLKRAKAVPELGAKVIAVQQEYKCVIIIQPPCHYSHGWQPLHLGYRKKRVRQGCC